MLKTVDINEIRYDLYPQFVQKPDVFSLLQMKGLMILLAVHTMLLQKCCIGHIVQKQTCGVLVSSLIYYFVVADHSGPELNQGFSAQYCELTLILMTHHGNQYLPKLKILSKDFLTRTTEKE